MNCPIDGTPLLVAHRSEIEIDICPVCRGVWLDRGELNKLITLAHDRTGPLRPPAIRRLRRTFPAGLPDATPIGATPAAENWLADFFPDTAPSADPEPDPDGPPPGPPPAA